MYFKIRLVYLIINVVKHLYFGLVSYFCTLPFFLSLGLVFRHYFVEVLNIISCKYKCFEGS